MPGTRESAESPIQRNLQAEMDVASPRVFNGKKRAPFCTLTDVCQPHPRPITYLPLCSARVGCTIFNMWFLWLAGFVLEDRGAG